MKREDAKQLAERAVADLEESLSQGRNETLQKYLDAMSRFHQYSWSNSLLIAMQMPEATYVAGFRRWLELGRHVRKGEKGIGIVAPMAYRQRDEGSSSDDSDAVIRGFKVVHVFDVSQTEGEELPQLAAINGNADGLLPALENVVRKSGIGLLYEELPPGTKGVSRKGEIAIASGLTPAERFAVIAHELAHEWMHDKEARQGLPRTVRETEAEAVSYVVCRSFGFDCSTRSSDYIQMYRGDKDTLMSSLERIQRTACRMIESLQQSKDDAEEGQRHVA
jgi:antirestriction protein ArdC